MIISRRREGSGNKAQNLYQKVGETTLIPTLYLIIIYFSRDYTL
jgi:hypothetical protein